MEEGYLNILHKEGLYSGKAIADAWGKGLEVVKERKEISNCLILGVGGGSVIPVINNLWGNIPITGVEIDGALIKSIGNLGINLVIADANDFCSESNETYDLIIFDAFLGRNIPPQLSSSSFVASLLERLASSGILAINRPDSDESFESLFSAFFQSKEVVDAVSNTIILYQ